MLDTRTHSSKLNWVVIFLQSCGRNILFLFLDRISRAISISSKFFNYFNLIPQVLTFSCKSSHKIPIFYKCAQFLYLSIVFKYNCFINNDLLWVKTQSRYVSEHWKFYKKIVSLVRLYLFFLYNNKGASVPWVLLSFPWQFIN